MTETTKQRLVGSLLLLLVISAAAFFLIGKTNDDKAIVDDQKSDFISSIEPMPVEILEVEQEMLLDPHQFEEPVIKEELIKPIVPESVTKKEAALVKPVEKKVAAPIVDTSKPSWILQLGSFSVQANAQALHDKVVKLDFPSNIEQNGSNYRVRIGPEYDKKRVDEMVKALSEKLGITPQVLSQQTEQQ